MKRLLPLVLGATLLGASHPGRAQDAPPPREIRLVEKKLDQLSEGEVGTLGKHAFAIAPDKWKHAETDNFIIHYRRATEAQRVVREIEYNLWFVAKSLGAGKDRYAKKSHVYIFHGRGEWKTFLSDTNSPPWFGSFAYGDDLFLHVGGPGEEFDSHALAHETTHAVVARLYPEKRWPLWLNEGFSEYMGGASVAARKQQYIKGLQRDLSGADLTFDQLVAMTEYPSEQSQIAQLYRSGERVVRFLMTRFPKERIVTFIDSILAGNDFQKAVVEVYGDQVKDFDEFSKLYSRFEN
jgi:hypothetical protein